MQIALKNVGNVKKEDEPLFRLRLDATCDLFPSPQGYGALDPARYTRSIAELVSLGLIPAALPGGDDPAAVLDLPASVLLADLRAVTSAAAMRMLHAAAIFSASPTTKGYEAEGDRLRRPGECAQPDDAGNEDHEVGGDQRQEKPCRPGRQSALGEEAGDEGGRDAAHEVAAGRAEEVRDSARAAGEERQSQRSFGDVRGGRQRTAAAAQEAAGQQDGECLQGNGHRREREGDGHLCAQGDEQGEAGDERRIEYQRQGRGCGTDQVSVDG